MSGGRDTGLLYGRCTGAECTVVVMMPAAVWIRSGRMECAGCAGVLEPATRAEWERRHGTREVGAGEPGSEAFVERVLRAELTEAEEALLALTPDERRAVELCEQLEVPRDWEGGLPEDWSAVGTPVTASDAEGEDTDG